MYSDKLKKFISKDRWGNSLTYEFDVPPMEDAIPPAFQPGPKGTDTVPAWLTPGENVVNAEASRKFQPMIDKMNEYGRQVQQSQGGPIPTYESDGDKIEGKPAGKDISMKTVTDKKVYETPEGYKMSEQRITVGDNTHGYGHVPSIYEGMIYEPRDVKRMVYEGTVPPPDMRFNTRSEADHYAKLNSQNLLNFRDDAAYAYPMYNNTGGVVIDDALLDALMKVESGGDVNAESEAGAIGPYQIMDATAQQPGYGVTPIALADRTDPTKAREFARQYLQGIARKHPEFNRDQVLQAYHSGAGNVLKSIGGVEDLGPRGQAYAGKVNNAMKKADSGWSFPSFISTASASTLDNENKEVPEESSWLDSVKKKFDETFPSIANDPTIQKARIKTERKEAKEDATIAKKGTLFLDGLDDAEEELNEFKKEVKKKGFNVTQLDVDKLKDLTKKRDDLKLIYDEKAKKLEEVNKPTDFEKAAKEKIDTILGTKVAKDVVEATSIVGDDPSGGTEVAEMAKQDENTLMNKGLALGKEALSTVGGWFESMFKEMFSGPELARMAVIYAGSRAMGYSHGGSLNYSMKNYLTRVDSALAQRKKDGASKRFIDNYESGSIQKWIESGDMNDLKSRGTKSPIKMSGKGYLRGYGQVTLFDNKDGVQLAQVGGKYIEVSKLPIEQWDDKTHGDVAVSNRFNDIEKNFLSDLNEGLDKDDDEFVPRELTGARVNKIYRDILRRNGVSLNEAPQTEIAMQEAIKDYYTAIKQWKKDGKPEKGKPQSVEAFINRKIFTPLTGVPQAAIAGASVSNLNKLSNMIRDDMDNKNPQSTKYREEFKDSWQAVLDAYRKLPKEEQDKYVRQGADTEGHTAFTLFFQDKGIDGIEAILKG